MFIKEDHALVSMVKHLAPEVDPADGSSRLDPQDYCVGLVIAHDRTHTGLDPETCLRLRFWMILVNEKQLYPESKQEGRMSQIKTSAYSAGRPE